MKTTAIYARVSTTDKGQDINLQLSELKTYAEREGLENIEVYQDNGVSGSKTHRPALDRLMDDCQKGKVQTVIVWKFEPHGRSSKHLIEIAEEFKVLGIRAYISKTEHIDTSTPSGKAFYQMVGIFAEYEREIIRERVKAGLENARRNGKVLGRKPFHNISPEQVGELKRQGLSIRQIAGKLGCSTTPVMKACKK